MAKRLPVPKSTTALVGHNGYTLRVNDHGEEVASAVIVGTLTSKRHANVTLDWGQLVGLADWVNERTRGL